MKQQAQKMLVEAFKLYKKKHGKVDISKMARDCDLPYSSVYNPLYTGRRTNAEIWLKLMKALGAAHETEQGLVFSTKP